VPHIKKFPSSTEHPQWSDCGLPISGIRLRLHIEKIITRYVFTGRYNLQSDGTPHVLEGSLFLIISAELRAKQLARRRAPRIEILFSILLEGLPTVGASAGKALDREAADETHHTPPPGA
jgi:hypothetical protein